MFQIFFEFPRDNTENSRHRKKLTSLAGNPKQFSDIGCYDLYNKIAYALQFPEIDKAEFVTISLKTLNTGSMGK